MADNSDNFIPFNQSTPVHGGYNRNRQSGFSNNFQQKRRWHGNNTNRQRNNSSFGSDSSDRSNNSFRGNHGGHQAVDINAYLHPAMLQDPWAQLKAQNMNNSTA